MESTKRLWCGSRYNAWTCDREPGHTGKHQCHDGLTWANVEATASDAPAVPENAGQYGVYAVSTATVPWSNEGAENRFHRAGSEKISGLS